MIESLESDRSSTRDVDLVRALDVLASQPRLALLRQLRQARTLRDIRIFSAGDGGDERSISRQAIRDHLDRLIAIGVVQQREVEREFGPTVEYLVNHQALFALAEEVRSLARMRPIDEPRNETVRSPAE